MTGYWFINTVTFSKPSSERELTAGCVEGVPTFYLVWCKAVDLTYNIYKNLNFPICNNLDINCYTKYMPFRRLFWHKTSKNANVNTVKLPVFTREDMTVQNDTHAGNQYTRLRYDFNSTPDHFWGYISMRMNNILWMKVVLGDHLATVSRPQSSTNQSFTVEREKPMRNGVSATAVIVILPTANGNRL